MYKLIIRLDVEFVVLISLGLAPGNRVDFALAARLRFVFVTKLLTNNNRQRNVLLTRSIYLAFSLSLPLSLCVCLCVKQTTSAKFELDQIAFRSECFELCIHTYLRMISLNTQTCTHIHTHKHTPIVFN